MDRHVIHMPGAMNSITYTLSGVYGDDYQCNV